MFHLNFTESKITLNCLISLLLVVLLFDFFMGLYLFSIHMPSIHSIMSSVLMLSFGLLFRYNNTNYEYLFTKENSFE